MATIIIKTIIVVLTLVLISFGCYLILEERKKNRKKISFKEAMDLVELPVITFYNNGYKLNFLLDTGSNNSHINKSITPRLNITPINSKIEFSGIEGKKNNSTLCIMEIEYKNIKFKEQFAMSDLDAALNMIKKESGVQIHGVLGNQFFKRYRYILDFNELIAYNK